MQRSGAGLGASPGGARTLLHRTRRRRVRRSRRVRSRLAVRRPSQLRPWPWLTFWGVTGLREGAVPFRRPAASLSELHGCQAVTLQRGTHFILALKRHDALPFRRRRRRRATRGCEVRAPLHPTRVVQSTELQGLLPPRRGLEHTQGAVRTARLRKGGLGGRYREGSRGGGHATRAAAGNARVEGAQRWRGRASGAELVERRAQRPRRFDCLAVVLHLAGGARGGAGRRLGQHARAHASCRIAARLRAGPSARPRSSFPLPPAKPAPRAPASRA